MSLSGCFSKALRSGFLKKSNFGYCRAFIAKYSQIWEPDYLKLAETKTPEYDLINVQIKGYDFAVLERYQKLIRRLARILEINIQKCWPAPEQEFLIHHYKVNSTETQYTYSLKLHERNVQVVDVKSHIMALFIEVVTTTCPPGVKLSFHEHENQMEEIRYIPNQNVLELQELLDDIGKGKNKKTKKK